MSGEAFEYVVGYRELRDELDRRESDGTDYRQHTDTVWSRVDQFHPGRLQLRVAEVLDETPSTKTFRMRSLDRDLPPFEAGQYVNLFVNIEGATTSRPFAISSAPQQRDYYDLTVKRLPGGLVSNYLLDEVEAGDLLESTGPMGSFHYNPLWQGDDLVFLAGGSGIAPAMSMIRDMINRNVARRFHLIYGSSADDDIIFADELARLSAEVTVRSRPQQGLDLTGVTDPQPAAESTPRLTAQPAPPRSGKPDSPASAESEPYLGKESEPPQSAESERPESAESASRPASRSGPARLWELTVTHVVSDPSQTYRGRTGFIDAALIAAVVPAPQNCTFFICGPPAMYDYCMPEVQELGVPRRRIRLEASGAPVNPTSRSDWTQGVTDVDRFTVTLPDGRRIDAPATTPLLDTLERNVAGFTFAACRSGECSLCRLKLVAGTVYEPEEAKVRRTDSDQGYIHSCVSYLTSDLTLDY